MPGGEGLTLLRMASPGARERGLSLLRRVNEPVTPLGNDSLACSQSGRAALEEAGFAVQPDDEQAQDPTLTDPELDEKVRRMVEQTAELKKQAQETRSATEQLDNERRALAEGWMDKLQALLPSVEYQIQLAAAQASADDPAVMAEELHALLRQREEDLAAKYKELHAKEEEDRKLTEELTKLQTKDREAIREMLQDRAERLEQIESNYYRDIHKLEDSYEDNRQRTQRLAWHVKRGTHVRPVAKDMREKGLFNKECVHENDRRLKGQEEKLLIEHRAKKAELDNQQAEKVLLSRRREAVAAQWDAKPPKQREGKTAPSRPQEGTKLWYDMEVARLEQMKKEEADKLKKLTDENFELKEARKKTEAEKREITRARNDQLAKQQRAAVRKQAVPQIAAPAVRRTGEARPKPETLRIAAAAKEEDAKRRAARRTAGATPKA